MILYQFHSYCLFLKSQKNIRICFLLSIFFPVRGNMLMYILNYCICVCVHVSQKIKLYFNYFRFQFLERNTSSAWSKMYLIILLLSRLSTPALNWMYFTKRWKRWMNLILGNCHQVPFSSVFMEFRNYTFWSQRVNPIQPT